MTAQEGRDAHTDGTRQPLKATTDHELLAAIKRRDVSPVADSMPYSSFWQRDDEMRAEARRRGLL